MKHALILLGISMVLLVGCAQALPPAILAPTGDPVVNVIRVEGFNYFDQVLVGRRVRIATARATVKSQYQPSGASSVAHVSAFGTAVDSEYQTVQMSDRRYAMIYALENTRVSRYVVAEGPADFVISGTRSWANGDLDKASTLPAKLVVGLSLIALFGAPIPEHAGAHVTARIYDSTGQFVQELSEEHERLFVTTLYTARRDQPARAQELVERAIERLASRIAYKIREIAEANPPR